jgi:hypothetical protein
MCSRVSNGGASNGNFCVRPSWNLCGSSGGSTGGGAAGGGAAGGGSPSCSARGVACSAGGECCSSSCDAIDETCD